MERAQDNRSGWLAGEDQSAAFVELFFDLVFVFGITKITGFLAHDPTWSGAYQAALILWLVWWAWTQFTWTLNPANTAGRPGSHMEGPVAAAFATGLVFFLETLTFGLAECGART